MIIGILLGISLAVFISSLLILIFEFNNLISQNAITGATIGSIPVASYAIIFLFFSTIAIIFLISLMNRKLTRNKP